MAPMVPVKSSMLQAVGYDAAQRVLNVRFNNSAFVHPSLDVPPEAHAELMASESIGQAYNRLIRGKFTAGSPVKVEERVGEEAEALDVSA